jgi:tRNA pseudouridine38-40 synthase
LEAAVARLTGEKIRIHLASRTDAGVSAAEQVASFRTSLRLPGRTVADALNHFLPADIAVKKVFRVPDTFDVRRHAVSREYRYRILNTRIPSPLRERHSYRVYGELDIAAMEQAVGKLVGEHDLAAFASKLGRRPGTTIRRILAAGLTSEGEELVFRIVAKSFLPHMVRNIVGVLVKIGTGRLTVAEFEKLLSAAVPGSAGPAAPGKGLCLIKVNYAKDLGEYNEDI